MSPQALSVPDKDSYTRMLHTLFALEDIYGLTVGEADGEIVLRVNVHKNKDADALHRMLCAWQEQAGNLETGEITNEDYDNWRYHYPESDATQIRANVPSQALMDDLTKDLSQT